MKYWEEFESKFGFGDGDAVPPDAWALRYVYVRELNRLAKANGSAVRAYAFDRGGMHNPYMILRAAADKIDGEPEEKICGGGLGYVESPEPDEDAAFGDAVAELNGSDIDELVVCGKARISKRHAKAM